jgi:hypothetical protein
MDGWNVKPNGWEFIDHKYIDIKKPKIKNFNLEIDGIFVLAGGIDSNGFCYPWVIRRLNLAYNIHKSTNKPIFCLGGGSYHVAPILNKNNFAIHESTSCSEYLISLGVEPNMIYKEWSSYDTIANGYFGFVNHIIPLGLKNIVLITSEFHIERSKVIFDWMKNIFNCQININYMSITDKDLNKDVINHRIIREKKSKENLEKNVISKIQNIKSFHKWFFTEHEAYKSNSELERKKLVTDEEIKTY